MKDEVAIPSVSHFLESSQKMKGWSSCESRALAETLLSVCTEHLAPLPARCIVDVLDDCFEKDWLSELGRKALCYSRLNLDRVPEYERFPMTSEALCLGPSGAGSPDSHCARHFGTDAEQVTYIKALHGISLRALVRKNS